MLDINDIVRFDLAPPDALRLYNLLGAIQDAIWCIHGEAIDFYLQGQDAIVEATDSQDAHAE